MSKKLIILGIVLSVCAGFLFAETINVPSNYLTIQSAIDSSIAGDTVLVSDGHYYETLSIVGKSITILSENGPDDTFIDGYGGDTNIVILVYGGIFGSEINITVSGFTIMNSTYGIFSGFANGISNCFIKNCIFKDNTRGIYAYGRDKWDIKNSLFFNNGIGYRNTYYAKDCIISNCTFDNTIDIEFRPEYSPTVELSVYNSIFIGQTKGYHPNSVKMHYCNYDSAKADDKVIDIEGNIFVDPLFVNAASYNFSLQPLSPCIDAGDPDFPNDPDGTCADMGAYYFHQVNVSMPDMEIFRKDTIIIPIEMKLPEDYSYSSVRLEINGGLNEFVFIGLSPDMGQVVEAGWTFYHNETDTSLLIVGAGANSITTDGDLIYLELYVPETVPDTTTIVISDIKIDEKIDPVLLLSGNLTVYNPAYGDVSRNGEITPYDASLILKYCVDLISLDSRQQLNADVSLDSTISALDASLVLQYNIGIIDSLPYSDPEQLNCSGVITMEDADIIPGDTVFIPVYINNGGNILSCEGKLSYDISKLEFIDVKWTSDPDNVVYALNQSDNSVSFSIASSYPDGQECEFLTLKFRVNPGFSEESTILSIDQLRLNEGEIQENVASITLTKTITNTSNLGVPMEFELNQNYPNPFNPTTRLQYGLPEASDVDLVIFNITGRKIKEWSVSNQHAGWHEVIWDGTDMSGNIVSTGVYIYSLRAGGFVDTKKMVFMK